MNDQCLAAFEQWWTQTQGNGHHFPPDLYAWEGWQAAWNAGRWISVDDELPPIGEPIILCSELGTVQHHTYYLDASESDDSTWWNLVGDKNFEFCESIKSGQRWQPLPEPPQDGNE